MALYWPKEKVALDIIDDPYRRPFEGDDSYTVLRVTCADLCDFDSYRKVMTRLGELVGKDVPMPDGEGFDPPAFFEDLDPSGDLLEGWDDDAGLSNVQILASNEEEAQMMRSAAQKSGQYVRGVTLWDGPTPPGSYEQISSNMRMSTPEYFFLRKSNELPFPDAVRLGIELCGKFRTSITQYDRFEGYDFLRNPRTTKARIRTYLRGARHTKEGKRARRVLRLITDNCSSPMGCYLYLLLCLPRAYGGYGIERAKLSAVYEGARGFMPSATGKYIAYDLCWPDQRVALQYTGTRRPGEKVLRALQAEGMRAVCVTDGDLASPQAFEHVALKVIELLGKTAPERDEKWGQRQERLFKHMALPEYDHMRLTMGDLEWHLVG